MINGKIYHAMIVFSKPSEKTPGKRQLDMKTATFAKKEDAIAYVDKICEDPEYNNPEGKKIKLARVDEICEIVEVVE